MQDKHSKDFDLQLRSMLEDAEVRAPRRVWKGISARLDAANAPAANPWGWMKWAGMSLAAAAAIAAGVFFSGTRTSIPTINHNQEQATLLAQTGEQSGAETEVTAPDAPATQDAVSIPASRPATRKAALTQSSAEPADRTDAPAAGMAAEASEPAVGESETPAKAANPRKPRTEVPAFADPFAVGDQGRKSSAFKPGVALYAQGSIGSNDADSRPAASAWMAPGQSTGFSELSSSTYGIPFTLGLGVRIGVLPRLAVGVGLDYSLLTRTFTGSYGDVSGTVLHSLQYVGVPLNLYYGLIDSPRFRLYVFGGGEAEFCISNRYKLFAGPDIVRSYPVDRLQYSVGGGFGVEFRINDRLGIYLDPGVHYYFPGNQPKSIRTDKPLLVNFDAGLRFNLGR
ncbi:MAG: outer membrane beta-barrel protein [Bacteroidales bacterium]|nr:outer membrane beta-barrel protein [Bacteroidales bacterium]